MSARRPLPRTTIVGKASGWESAVPGLVGRTLLPLIGGTVLVLGVATWLAYSRSVVAVRAAARDQMDDWTQERTRREGTLFARVEQQLRHGKRILEGRLASNLPTTPVPLAADGSRRQLPATGPATPLAAFVAARAAGDPIQSTAAARARDLLGELGPAWSEDLAGVAIAAPGSWFAGWGDDQARLVADMLPDDPVLLEEELELLAGGADGVIHWSKAWREPASGTWFLSAAIASDAPGIGRVAIIQALPVDDAIARATLGQAPGARTVVLDRSGLVLAGDRSNRLAEDDPLAVLPAMGPESELVIDPRHDAWLGISRFPGPGWIMATMQPTALIDARARREASVMPLAGAVLLVIQLALLVALLHRRIARPLRALAATAEKLAAGERGVALPTARGDEIGGLSRAFVQMDQSISAGESGLREALAAVREREEFSRALVDSAADAVVVIADGRIVESNPRAAALFAAGETGLRNRLLAELAPARQADGGESAALLAAHAVAARAGAPRQFACQLARCDGAAFEAEIGLARVDLPGRERLLAVIRDISERKLQEERLRQFEKLESVGQLAGGVAHDFNNMLAGIMAAAELLRGRSDRDPAARRLTDDILLSCERAAALTRQLLDFSRNRRPTRIPLDVHRVIADTIAMVERAVDKRIAIAVDLGAMRTTVVGDAAQLQNAMLNLALNARDAMPDGGRITFRTEVVALDAEQALRLNGQASAGPHLAIRVTDTGTGIAPAVIERIFEPFFTTKPVGKGTGLGLAAVYRSLCDHRGGIAVESEPGRGTAFTLYLPLSDEPAPKPPTHQPPPPAGDKATTILVVDDEDLVRRLASDMLQVLGYRTLEARDGLDGVRVFSENRDVISAVLLDSEMPGLRGPECLRQIRVLAPNMRGVLCSGFAREGLPEDLREAGFTAIVNKPFRLYDLATAIAAAVEQPQAAG